MARTVAIGIQNFSELIEKNCFYIDKTLFIKEWWESNDNTTLITRPRRFGKTLNMSMLEQFFSLDYAGRGDLFERLAIWQEEEYRALQGTYPVIALSFAKVKSADYKTTRKTICMILRRLYTKFSYVLESGKLDEQDKEYYRRVSDHMDDSDAANALHNLSDYLYRCHGKKSSSC